MPILQIKKQRPQRSKDLPEVTHLTLAEVVILHYREPPSPLLTLSLFFLAPLQGAGPE